MNDRTRSSTLRHAGYLLGFSLGGFFDGILLHQILQWHHLLSGITRAPFSDLRTQVLADGLFHAAMYVIAAIGLWQLLRARATLARRSANRTLVADLLIGFGAWHVLDSVLSHWLLEIHRIRMDVPNPLFWDLLWFGLFGVLFIIAGIILRRRAADDERGGPTARSLASPLIVTVAATALASAFPMFDRSNTMTVTVVMRPGATPVQLLAGLQGTGARLLWSGDRGTVWVLALDRPADRFRLYAHGALFVSGTLLPAGCSAWMRT